MIQEVANNQNLARVGRLANLNAFVLLAHGVGEPSARTMATTVEAILGAVYLDSSLADVRHVMVTLGLVSA